MSTFDDPFDAGRNLGAGCVCGQHRSAREHEQVTRLADRRRAQHEQEARRRERQAGDEISILMHLSESAVRA